MSRFFYPKPTAERVATIEPPVQQARPQARPTSVTPPRRIALPKAQEVPASMAQRIGTIALCVYLIGAYATDLSLRLLHLKPYFSTAAGVVVLLAFIACGPALLSIFKSSIAKAWLFLATWMLLAVVGSRWQGGSMLMLQSYLPKSYMVLFFTIAFAVTLSQVRILFWANLAIAVAVLLSAIAFGDAGSGRLGIPDSMLLENPNDLALALLIASAFFLYLILEASLAGKMLGMIALAGALYYINATGSRGSIVALGAALVAVLVVHEQRLKVLAFMVVMAGLVIPFASSGVFHRLSLVFDAGDAAQQGNDADRGSILSQVERQELLNKSLEYTIKNPLLGVGPGQFSLAYWTDAKAAGIHVPDLGTHNAYTQMSSELGIPGGIGFLVCVVLFVRTNYKSYKKVRLYPQLSTLTNMSFCLFVCTVSFAVNAIFHHVGYAMYIPVIGGLTVALSNTAEWHANQAMAAAPAKTR